MSTIQFTPHASSERKNVFDVVLQEHNMAKEYLKEKMQPPLATYHAVVNAATTITTTTTPTIPDINSWKEIASNLNVIEGTNKAANIFSWEITRGVKEDIEKSATTTNEDEMIFYGAASQYNSCESPGRFTPKIGSGREWYLQDRTQGPQAQLAFSNSSSDDDILETILVAANKGFNGLAKMLSSCNDMSDDEYYLGVVQHGYLTPRTDQEAKKLLQCLIDYGHEMEALHFTAVPNNVPEGHSVSLILVAAPAFGQYNLNQSLSKEVEQKITFMCVAHAARIQANAIIKWHTATTNKDINNNVSKTLVWKPTGVGLGVFGNNPLAAAAGFAWGVKDLKSTFMEIGLKVIFQPFARHGEPARDGSNAQMDMVLYFNLNKNTL